MQLTGYLDKGASLGPGAPCLTMGEVTLSYGQVQELSWRIARALARSGVRPGDKVAILSSMIRRFLLRVRDRQGRCGVVPGSTRATRRPGTGSCSICSTAPA